MDIATYAVEAEIEATHWWFVGRRQLFGHEIARMGIDRSADVLDVGTSTGTNLRMMRELGFRNVQGLELEPAAIQFCAQKGLGQVTQGNICDIPFPGQSFDFVLATDIIEHVDDDRQALCELRRVLRPGGRILITVPAFPSLWGLQDRVSHHKRRYRHTQLRHLIETAGLSVDRSYYFNYLLFVPIWLARRVIDLLGLELKSEGELNSPLINRICQMVFRLDTLTAPYLRPPFGVSILAIAGKK